MKLSKVASRGHAAISLEARVAARAEAADIPELLGVFDLERPKEPGELDEPEGDLLA